MNAKNAINWFELAVSDLPRARKFYETVFRCSLQEFAAPDHVMAMFPFDMTGGVGGCLTLMAGMNPGPGGTVVYLNADGDLDGVIARVTPAGGGVLKPKTGIGEHGHIAIIRDTEGNVVGVHAYR